MDILAIGIFFILLVAIYKIVRGHACLAAVLTIPLLLYCAIRYYNHFGEQEGHRFTELANKGYLLGRTHVIPGFLDNTCYEQSYYLPPGSVWLESIAKVDGCNDDCNDIEISEIKVSDPLIIFRMNSCSLQNLLIRSTSGKWRGFHVPPMYEGYESSADGFDLFFEDFDYNAGSYAIQKYRLTVDGSGFKYGPQTSLNTPRQALDETAIRSPKELSIKVRGLIETKQIDDVEKLITPDTDSSSIHSLKEMLSTYIGAEDLSVNVVPRNDLEAQWKFLSGTRVPGIIMPLADRVKKYESEGNYFSIIPLGDIVISGKHTGVNTQWSKSSIMYGVLNGKYVITFAKKKKR